MLKHRACHQARELAEAELEQAMHYEEVLAYMAEKGVRFGDFLDYMFNPANGQGKVYYHEFLIRHGSLSQMLDWWSSSDYSSNVKAELHEWAMTYLEKTVTREARKISKSRRLQTQGKSIDEKLVTSFSFLELHDELSNELAPNSMRLIGALATSRNANTHTDSRKERTKLVITSAALTCLGEYSHSNNLAKRMIGLYLYANGAQRQTIAVLSNLGLSESYSNIVSRNVRRHRTSAVADTSGALDPNVPKKIEYTGTLTQLSEAMRAKSHEVASTGLFASVYDNINLQMKSAEQVIGRHDSQENGTCATITPLFDASLDDIKVADFQSNFLDADPLSTKDILHSPDECDTFQKNLIFTILRTIIKFGGDKFKHFEKELNKNQPKTKEKIKLHKSELYPLPPWNIDESTITGNAEVDEAIVNELKLKDIPEFSDRVRFQGGDQLSIACLRALEIIRGGQESGYNGFFWGAWMPGLFHAKMADMQGTLLSHWGTPNTGARNPGSLWFHNTRLDRLPITTTSLPPFRVCRDLVFISLYARVLHCLLLVSGCNSLDKYSAKFTSWDSLVLHATKIYETYANSDTVDELRWQRKMETGDAEKAGTPSEKPAQGDMVYENGLLFLRDALISREFTDAVKAGDSGRVVLVLKMWALSFRGNGRTKYAHEMLHLIHNLEKVWDEKTKKAVLNNWLLNPTGNEESWVEIDLVQEHLNFWIKTWYKAHGVNTSWDWLAMVGPCVNVLRQLARHFNQELGSDQGTKHASPDLSKDIDCLMSSLAEYKVYELQPGRTLDDEEKPVKDVIQVGFRNLTDGTKSPLSDYNEAFRRLQECRRMKTVAQMMSEHSEHLPPPTETTPSLPTNQCNVEPTEVPAGSTTATHISPKSPDEAANEGVRREFDEMDIDEEWWGLPETARMFRDMEDEVIALTLVEDSLPPLVTEGDVAFDMDVELVEDDQAVEEESDDSGDEFEASSDEEEV
ncbi:hypothetical protein HYPSUDRAFT_1084706 [Hypholoma sublateritium FD-334 SS-4]|uniref:DUF6589 domain-containing protein n=1 Tax=Hypholoma sublateritium (strain FD-334 SS-4) TaxID=945553 RepID=A0A0D2MF96_HYPSF|nr:hypothetical protein HYPSUDRAFT_1084706 [Hypholoma sublateritium FD-334 SS-4]